MAKAASQSLFKAILIGGSLAAALDILEPILFFGVRGIPALRVPQSIAAGLLGHAAYTGGLRTALIGLALHVLLALFWAAGFVLASRSMPFLTRRAIASGLLYGAFIYVVMNFLVLPHSHAATHGHPRGIFLLNGIASILLLVGLPISLVNQSFAPRTARPRVSSKTHA